MVSFACGYEAFGGRTGPAQRIGVALDTGRHDSAFQEEKELIGQGTGLFKAGRACPITQQ